MGPRDGATGLTRAPHRAHLPQCPSGLRRESAWGRATPGDCPRAVGLGGLPPPTRPDRPHAAAGPATDGRRRVGAVAGPRGPGSERTLTEPPGRGPESPRLPPAQREQGPPPTKLPETEARFAHLADQEGKPFAETASAPAGPVKRLSRAGKAPVKRGDSARAGKTRGDYRAADHERGRTPTYVPFGRVEQDRGQLYLTFGSSSKTSDVIVERGDDG